MPHENNYKYYDFIMEKRYGKVNIQNLTDSNIRLINTIIQNGKIIDVGSGTGRLAIPLTQIGFEVVGIDQCTGMNDELQKKALKNNLNIATHLSINGTQVNDADMAIAIFTVLSYINEKSDLKQLFLDIHNSLKPGGYFLFDLSHKEPYFKISNNGGIISEKNELDFIDNVKIVCDLNKESCNYKEKTLGVMNDENFECDENFVIKFWDFEKVYTWLLEVGFERSNHQLNINIPGATYYLFQKIA